MNRHTMVILMLEYTPYGYRLAVRYVCDYACVYRRGRKLMGDIINVSFSSNHAHCRGKFIHYFF